MSEHVCSQCRHWHRGEPNPMDLGAPVPGQCRALPPQLVWIPVKGGQMLQPMYPALVAETAACGQFRLSLLTVPHVNGEGS